MAFAGPITWYTAGLEKETGLSGLFRFGIVPLFLFSGTFFPISQLPDFIEPLAFVVPLWHGVELTRSIALGTTATLPWSVHLAVLLGCTIVGAVGAADRLRRRLVV